MQLKQEQISQPEEELGGEIKRVRFENPDTGFAVLVVQVPRHAVPMVFCGNLSGLQPGQRIVATGRRTRHSEFGEQFNVSSYRTELPTSGAGMSRYLTCAVPGIGKKKAELLLKRFGDNLQEVLENSPSRILEVKGISRKDVANIVKIWKESAARRNSMVYLQGLGLTPAFCNRLFKRYGENAAEAVKQNPYRLAEDIEGVGFLRADIIAKAQGFAPDAIERLTAAALYSLNTLIEAGNVCAAKEELLRICAELTGQPEEVAARGIQNAVERKMIRLDSDYLYAPFLLAAERALPVLIEELGGVKRFHGMKLAKVAAKPGLQLAPEQQQAVEQVVKQPLTIITGGPGVGKTTVIGEIVRRARAAALDFTLAAPTGRAAKRLGEASGVSAKTIHRLLSFDPATGKFDYNRNHRLSCQLLIVDECSMLDLPLATQLFSALEPSCSVVLVGDADQLPSVGPGTVFHDLIFSGKFGVTRLTKIFRQASGSGIITNAHRVNQGLMPQNSPQSSQLTDFYWIEQDDPEKVAKIVETLAAERIPSRFGFKPTSEIQVLVPMNKGICGTISLNERLEKLLNPAERANFQRGDRIFKEGDKVMQTANDYEKLVFNGDLGFIEYIFNSKKKFVVRFDDDRCVEFSFDESASLVPAYAITIHKSQGSEFPAVIVPLLSQHFVMLQRNLLYTAMTRAKKLLVLVGSRRAVEIAVHNTHIEPRLSLLLPRLTAL